jgi:transglutaminase superfamily protein
MPPLAVINTDDDAAPRITRRGRLTVSNLRLLGVVTALQLTSAAALRLFALRRVRAGAARAAALIARGLGADESRVVWAIEATGRRLGRSSSCLGRAIVAEAILRSAGNPVQLTIGIRRGGPGGLQAHAWVSRGDRVLVGAAADDYAPLVEWSDRCR